MRRREFLSSVVAGSAAASVAGAAGTAGAVGTDDGTIPPMAFDSAASLLDADGRPLTDESLVAVWAAATATNTDADGDDDAVAYPGDVAVPMAAVEGSVLALGGTLVEDDTDYSYGNEEFLLNAWDDLVGGGTVLWDESHGQFYTKDRFRTFETYVEEAGYDLRASSDLLADLPDADGVVVTSPSDAFTDEELSALSSFVADGGALFLHHRSDFRNFDETDNLNAVASALDLSIRFNDDQVVDEENNVGVEFVPVTDRFNDGTVDYFDDRDGLELSPGDTYDATVTSVTDGDTVVLVGAAPAPDHARENLNELASAVGTDLRLNDDEVTDPESNVDDDPSVPTTDRFDRSFDLFSPFEPGGDGRTEEFAGELDPRGKDAYTYAIGDDPRTVEVDLSGPDDADFDLYLALDGREPGRRDHDRRSWHYGSEESNTLGGGTVESGDELGIAVDAYSGAGAYTLTVTER